ncbi:MAG TPA: 30S ribosomal protein S8 [Deltaproteobacteria bacterium]|nr:MAG: 30S ribosomal protein S8 [Deltaproteobacteria bacterium GWA2_45_12]HBF13591.1 30S ribosomal protein S8 [Deltaproteobacteria bacterium]
MTTDPIADLLTRIRNGLKARHASVKIPSSKVKEEILKIFKQEGFISSYVKEEVAPQAQLTVFLKYDLNKKSTIRKMNRVSRSGRRIYRGYRDIKPLLKGSGVQVLSTPKGIISDREARHSKIGGEVLCQIW